MKIPGSNNPNPSHPASNNHQESRKSGLTLPNINTETAKPLKGRCEKDSSDRSMAFLFSKSGVFKKN